MATDLSKTSDAQLLDLINADNSSSLNETHVLFDIPTPLVDDPDGKNTTIDVVSRPNGGYSGSVNIKYDRLNLNGFVAYGDPILVIPDGGGLAEVVDAFNLLYSANIELAEDIDETVTLPTLDYQLQPYTLTSKAESLAYFGSIDVSVRFETTELSSVIVTSTFEGLEFAIPQGDPLVGEYTATASINATRNFGYTTSGNNFYMFGGYTGSTVNTLRIYNYLTNTWSTGSTTNGPAARTSSVLVALGEYIYCFNGDASRQIFRYSITDDSWVRLGTDWPTSPATVTDHRGCAINGKIYLFGGIDDISNTLNTMTEYDPANDSYTVKTPAPRPRRFHSMVAVDKKIFLIGGLTAAGTANIIPEVDIYNTETDTWSTGTDCPAPGTYSTATEINGFIYVFGGGVSSNTRKLLRYDPVEHSWFDYGDFGTVNRGRHGAGSYNGELFIFSGLISGTTLTDTTFKVS